LYLAILVWHIRRHHGLGFSLGAASRKRAREMALYTGKTFASLIAGSFLGVVDRLILAKLAPAAAFNPYFISANVGGRLQGLGSAVMGPVFHNTSRAVGGGRVLSAAAIYDEMFTFTFGWYLLAAVWTAVWHPVLLHLWLGDELGTRVAPLFTPIIVGFCITALASISGVQLGPLDRVGTSVGFNVAAGLLTAIGVYVGWRLGGVVGVAYGFLASRIVLLAQDIYVIRLVKATGWFNLRIWLGVVVQGLLGGLFALVYLVAPYDSAWLLVPAALHAGLVATWLLRHPLRRLFGLSASRSSRSVASPHDP
jgi:O-antigen/teichoic acid export membrane protein